MKKQMSLWTVTSCLVVTASFVPTAALGDFDGVEAPDKFKDVDVDERPADEGGWYGDVEWPEVSPKDELTGESAFESMLIEVPSAKYPTLQSAINSAKDGDVIHARMCYFNESLNTLGKHLTIRGVVPKEYMRHHVLDYTLEEAMSGAAGEVGYYSPNYYEFSTIEPPSPGDPRSGYSTGAIVVVGGSLTLENFFISGFDSDRGAGVIVLDGDIHLRNCVFSNNQVSDREAADAMGGAVYFDSPDSWQRSTIENCHFKGNTSSGSGGAIHVASGWLDVIACSFKFNSATEGGAVMYAGGSGHIDHSVCLHNNAWKGGAIRMIGETGLSISRCEFIGNTASFGAGLHAGNIESGRDRSYQPKQPCSVLSCWFVVNDARFAGSGVHLMGPDMYVHGCTFQMNRLAIDGGSALYFEDVYTGEPRVQSTRICSNEGEQVMGTWLDEGANCIMSHCDAALCDNDLDVDGNGYIDWADWELVDVEMMLASLEGRSSCYACPEDVNGDGAVDYLDLSLISRHIYAAPSGPVRRSGSS